MRPKMLNLACGATYVVDECWTNIDFNSGADGVIGLNLLEPTPFAAATFDLVYSSHFFEHLPVHRLSAVLDDWHRILVSGGVLRLVLPDCEEMFCEFLRQRRDGNHLLADFVIAEIVDQCVRTYPGGLLSRFYERAALGVGSESTMLSSYITERNGEAFSYFQDPVNLTRPDQAETWLVRALRRLRRGALHSTHCIADRLRIQALYALYGRAFVDQNISFASVGEKHHWLWDYHQVEQLLLAAGFVSVSRVSHQTSSFRDFPFIPLDMNSDGQPRKGLESMYIEARKPH